MWKKWISIVRNIPVKRKGTKGIEGCLDVRNTITHRAVRQLKHTKVATVVTSKNNSHNPINLISAPPM